MSIEYTIDIQLTELGFPEIVPRNSSGRETGSQSISASQKQKVQQADAAKETPSVAAVRCKAAHPSEGAQDEQGKGRTGESPAGTVNAAAPATGQGDAGHREGVDNDSDDSDVSDVCEEEELDDSVDVDGLHSGRPSSLSDI